MIFDAKAFHVMVWDSSFFGRHQVLPRQLDATGEG